MIARGTRTGIQNPAEGCPPGCAALGAACKSVGTFLMMWGEGGGGGWHCLLLRPLMMKTMLCLLLQRLAEGNPFKVPHWVSHASE